MLSLLSRFYNSFFLKNLSVKAFLSSKGLLGCNREAFTLNKSFADLTSYSSIVLVGLNTKLIAPVLNIRLRGLVKDCGIKIYNFGFSNPQSLFVDVGSTNDFFSVLKGKH